MKTNKKVVRLTESQLHNIITESVNQILNEMIDEGQGWDLFKSAVKDYNDRSEQDKERRLNQYNQEKNTEYFKQGKKNFIKTGDAEGRKGYVYKKDFPEEVDDPETYKSMEDVRRIHGEDPSSIINYKQWGKVNNSLRGKVGRAAGWTAAQGYYGLQNLKNKFRGR